MISHAVQIGRSHRLAGSNGQDAAFSASVGDDGAFGLVLDGCGAKLRGPGRVAQSRNEVGAQLLGQFLALRMRQASVDSTPLDAVGANLAEATQRFLWGVTALLPLYPDEQTAFVATRLLSTVVGFIVRPDAALVFWSGDGLVLVNSDVIPLDDGNQPDYPAYALIDGRERPFVTWHILNRADLRRLAVATDGWTADDLQTLPAACPSLLLQRWLNQRAAGTGRFDDDGAVAVWWQSGETEAPWQRS